MNNNRPDNHIPIMISAGQRLVYFGWYPEDQVDDLKIKTTLRLRNVRRLIRWSRTVGGLGGLAERGPNEDCLVEATVPWQIVHDVRIVRGCAPEAAERWLAKATVE